MSSIFNDYEGNASSMNLVWILSIITILSVWIFITIVTGVLAPVLTGDALWISTLFGGKVLQGFFEKKSPNPKAGGGGIIQDSNGKFNPARLIWILSVLGIVGTWAFLSIKQVDFLHFTTGHAAWFAALFSSKVGQTYIERSGMGGDDGDSDEYDYQSRSLDNESSDKDKLIDQLQDTIKVQSEFNKNLIEKIDPKK